MADSGIPISEWSGSAATDRLHETIEQFSKEAKRQTTTMIRLTRALVVLTIVLVIGLIVQVASG